MNETSTLLSPVDSLVIRGLSINPPLFLAPMAGLTHSALRTVILSFGGIGLLSTEMLAAWRVPNENPHISPFLLRTEKEGPLSYQLLLNDAVLVEPALAALERFGADAVDFNLGCPAPRVKRAGGGCRLASDHGAVRHIVKTARTASRLPLTAKIRLGEELNEGRLVDFCMMLEDEGVDLITIHARLNRESFSRHPRWEWISRVKRRVKVPVVANGGIDSVQTARRCLEMSGADGLMIGRASAVKPWLFAEIAEAVYGVPRGYATVSRPKTYNAFAVALQTRFRPERRLGRLKEFTHYFAGNYAFGHHLAGKVQASDTFAQALQAAGAFFFGNDKERFSEAADEMGPDFILLPSGG